MSTIERAISKLSGEDAPVPVAPVVVERRPSAPVIDDVRPLDDAPTGQEDKQSRIELNPEKLRASGLVTPDDERSQIAEEFRHIKRPLLLNAFGDGALQAHNRNLIMVTSARPSEGKTFTAVNLALSIALERERTVLLVDADVARPSVSRLLDFPGTAGLVDFLADQNRPLSHLILRTSVPKLRILPSGRRHAHSTELLASEIMSALVQELSQRYPDRIVLFDSPPLLATSEAAVLAGLMGQVVMVVEAGKTKHDELKEALALLDPQQQYVGMVLNKSSKPFGADYYYGSYKAYGE